ncbi:MAG: TaqI-like C-terminal specificity domain-containing protein, partial [Candidatus Methanomethyliaceae archaeon]
FLDHHLRVGNSLIGAWVKDLGSLPGKGKKGRAAPIDPHTVGLFEGKLKERLPVVLGEVMELLRKPSDRVEDIREKETIYSRILELLRPFKEVADVWTATWFGVEVSETEYEDMLPKLADTPQVWESEVRSRGWFQRALEEAAHRHFFHWELEFPEVFFGSEARRSPDGGFNAVVGNPPYQFGENVPADTKPFYEHNFSLASGQYDTYWLFCERSFDLLTVNGFHGFIVPDAMLVRDEAEKLRTKLLFEAKLTDLAPVGPVFNDPNVSAVILICQQGRPNAQNVRVWCRHGEMLSYVQSWSQSILAKTPRCRLWVSLSAAQYALIMKIIQQTTVLSAFVDISRGEELGRKDLKKASRTTPSNNIDFIPILIGEDIAPLNAPESTHVIARDCITKPIENYSSTKIVLRKTGRTLVATVDNKRFVTLQSVYNLVNKQCNPLSIFYLAALLKSTLLSYFVQTTVTEYKGLFPQLNQTTVEELPIRRIAFVTPKENRQMLVEKAKKLYYAGLKADRETISASTAFSKVVQIVESCLKKVFQPDPGLVLKHNCDPLNRDWQIPEGALWEQSDVVHDILAFLAEEMIRLNQEKQREMKSFLAWLEAELQVQPNKYGDTGIEALTGKTQLKNYLGDYQKNEPELPFEELWKILQKNKSRIGRKLTHEFMAELHAAYERTLAKLRPIKERLRLTDDLIDQIVYPLYGLTKEEITLVEKSQDTL